MEPLSGTLRAQGKENFAGMMNAQNLSDETYMAKASQIIMDFTLAAKAAKTDQEKALSYQNLAIACTKALERTTDKEKFKAFARAAILNFSNAHYCGSKEQPREWLESIANKALSSFGCICSKLELLGEENQNSVLQALNEAASPVFVDVKLQLCFKLAFSGYMQAQTFYNCKSFAEAEQKICEYCQFLEEACKLIYSSTTNIEMKEKIEDLVKDWENLVIYTLSMKEICNGDKLISQATVDPSNKKMMLIWSAINLYHLAVSITKELCVENEAIALGKIGKTYFEHIKNNEKARTYLERSVHLASSLPQCVLDKDWYKESNTALGDLHTKLADAFQQELREAKKSLKSEFEKINNASSESLKNLLKLLMKDYPPKPQLLKDFKLADDDTLNKRLKSTLHKVMEFYYADKQPKDNLKWLALTDEIMKKLNNHWENMKREPDDAEPENQDDHTDVGSVCATEKYPENQGDLSVELDSELEKDPENQADLSDLESVSELEIKQ